MIQIDEVLVKSLNAWDSRRARSQQVEVGPSSIGGCRREVWHELMQTPETNQTDKLAAILGTFIHAGIEEAIKREDPFGDNYLTELEVSALGLKGHVDLFIKDAGLVVDWKTKTKSSMRYFPSEQERWQVQLYGWLLEQNGYEVREVSLVAIPRDGSMAEIKVHREIYDAPTAETALAWFDHLKSLVAEGGPAPEPEMKPTWCSRFCSYYDPSGEVGCPSTTR